MVIDILSWVMLTAGGLFVFIGGLGALRMPNLYTRMHAASLTDTMAAVLIIGGIMLQAGINPPPIKHPGLLFFLLLYCPTVRYSPRRAAQISWPPAERAAVKGGW